MFQILAVADSGVLARRAAVAAHELGLVVLPDDPIDGDVTAVVARAVAAGAQAIHPGEAPVAAQLALARATEAAGLVFVGAEAAALAPLAGPGALDNAASELGLGRVTGDDGGRRIEVQVLADRDGEVVHLREREITGGGDTVLAPAPRLAGTVRSGLCRDAVRLVGRLGLTGAVTVVFTVVDDEYHVADVLPGLQLAHTVTEEVTNLDLVQAQLHLAAGARLADLGLTQDAVTVRGVAIQCRVTAEDVRGTTSRLPGGPGVRIDGERSRERVADVLAAMTCRGRDLVQAMRRTRRALGEFEVAGTATNLPALQHALAGSDSSA